MNTLQELAVLYEDNHLLLLNKPAGLLTQPVPGDPRPSLEDLAKDYLKEKYHKPGRVFLHGVHRIDRQVSGLVLFARTDKALSRLNQAMRSRQISKIYHALVEGKVEGEFNHPYSLVSQLLRSSHRAQVVGKKTGDAREARLEYLIVRRKKDTTLLQIRLDTGRYHQIRAQLASIGHPIAGDSKYGAVTSSGKREAITLHSHTIALSHPVGGQRLEVTAPYPDFWQVDW